MSTVTVEKEHVHKVYSEIAVHFSDTRFKPWPRIAKFLNDQPTGTLIADVGCGNGKYLGVNPSVAILGSDICPELVSIGRSRGHEVLVCDCLHLPYRSNLFDSIICIAVVHHLSTQARRQAAIKEMARVLHPGGSMLLYVWAMEQERKKFTQQDVMVPWHLQPKYRGDTGAKVIEEVKLKARKPKKERRKKRKKDSAAAEEGPDFGQDFRTEISGKDLKPHEDEEPVNLLECNAFCEERISAVAAGPLLRSGALCCEDWSSNPPVRDCRDDGQTQDNLEEPLATVQQEQNVKVLDQAVEERSVEDPVKNREESAKKETSLEDLGYSTYHRYYHVFKVGELSELVLEVPMLSVEQEYYDHENWCIIASKKAAV